MSDESAQLIDVQSRISGIGISLDQEGPTMGNSPQEVTRLLHAWVRGDRGALDQLVPQVYDELHRLAHIYMARERPGHTLQSSALVNEAYMRLVHADHIEWKDRAHFFAISANIMRRILVEFARARGSRKRGGAAHKVAFDEGLVPSPGRFRELVALDDALNALAAFDSREAQVVELRFFGGLTAEETAEVLKVSSKTVLREWEHAKVWLTRELKRGEVA
jgi:RNA polymerase sigma factor (TIGR02999 family)